MSISLIVTGGFSNGTISNSVSDVTLRGYFPADVLAQVSCVLVAPDGQPRKNLTAISWAWFDQTDPNLFTAPSDQSDDATTDSTGRFTLDLPNTTLTVGQQGSMVMRSDDGTLYGVWELTVE